MVNDQSSALIGYYQEGVKDKPRKLSQYLFKNYELKLERIDSKTYKVDGRSGRAVYKSGTGTRGQGQGDRDIGTRVWGLGTWGRETGDLRTSTMGPGDVWDGDGDAGTSKTGMQRTRDVNNY